LEKNAPPDTEKRRKKTEFLDKMLSRNIVSYFDFSIEMLKSLALGRKNKN